MNQDEQYDYSNPIEEIPGYLGNIFDDFVDFSDGLNPLTGFDFQIYARMADELDALQRSIVVDWGEGPVQISFDAYSIHEIVGAIPGVIAIYDCPPDQGPSAGSGHIFLLNEGSSLECVAHSAEILRNALDKDFYEIECEINPK